MDTLSGSITVPIDATLWPTRSAKHQCGQNTAYINMTQVKGHIRQVNTKCTTSYRNPMCSDNCSFSFLWNVMSLRSGVWPGWQQGEAGSKVTYLTSSRGPLKVVRGFLAPLVLAFVSPLSLSSAFKLSSRKFTWNNKDHLIRKATLNTDNVIMWPLSGSTYENEMLDPWLSWGESYQLMKPLAAICND